MYHGRVTIAELLEVLERIAPSDGAEPWDNTGLIVGAATWPASRVLLTIDLTQPVLAEAIEQGVDAVIAYHPPVFREMRTVTDATPAGAVALAAAGRRIAIISPHTRLDTVQGGINDWLAAAVGAGDVRALVPHPDLPQSEAFKLITFVPEDAAERLRDALAAVGAGRIGAYRRCAFFTRGFGTFEGDAGTNPAVGAAGRLERVDELRLEMVCAAESLPLAIVTLRQVHPYEEPAFEIHRLEPRPRRGAGGGRRVVLDQPVAMTEIVTRVRAHLGVPHLHVGRARCASEGIVRTIGLSAGAGGALLDSALRQGCDLFITGELRHHDVLAALERGCSVLLAGHSNTERGFLPHLRDALQPHCPDACLLISGRDADPLSLV